ncbi:MAG: GlsB/YeaQ/YmgE family stress response membrane protein [Pseudomonadota bacterium]
MNFILFLIIGGVAGWIAERVMKGNHSIFVNIGLGIVGAYVGGFLFNLLGLEVGAGIVPSLITATIGAILVIFVYRKVAK